MKERLIMKILLSNKTEDGTEYIVKIGGESVILNEQNDLKIPVAYGELDILIDRLSELKSKIKPIRGQRRLMNLYEDSAEDFELPVYKGFFYPKDKENNIHLSQKERNVIRIQIEDVLHKFEGYVDDHLYKNELELAKADHNVVMVTRSILSKLDVADCNEPSTYDYYLTMDLSRDGDNKAILFKKYENALKIEKFISFYEKDCTAMVHKFLKEIKGLNCAILIPTVAFGCLIVDYFKAEGFEDIIEINIKDINKAMNSDMSYIGGNRDEIYTRILLYTTSKLGLKL
jgi:hypothetical protein